MVLPIHDNKMILSPIASMRGQHWG